MEQGVTLIDPARFDLRGSIERLGIDIVCDVNVIIEGKNSIGNNVKIGPIPILKIPLSAIM